jgi:G3E family GTPase
LPARRQNHRLAAAMTSHMIKLPNFFRGDPQTSPEAAIQELLRAFLVRSNFLPGVRHQLGWRGLKQCAATLEGWTAKIRGFSGVFGIYFAGLEETPGWVTGGFPILYFPDPDEPLVEQCSLAAAAWAQQPDYGVRIREFLLHPELCSLFTIGALYLSIDPLQQALVLGLESQSVQRSIAEQGVRLMKDGRPVQVIEPGGLDQNFPAFSTSLAFYEVLAASVTFNLEQPPVYFHTSRFPGIQIAYDHHGMVRTTASEDIWKSVIILGYGEDDFEGFSASLFRQNGIPLQCTTWKAEDPVPPEYQDRLWWKAHQLKSTKAIDKKILGIHERPPLIMVSGFLGAGKTSFLRHFIEYQTQRHRFVAVIQNEIGEIGLDGKLLDYTVTEIDEGCVCCSLVGSLKLAVQGILSNFHPDYIVVETTGLANPLNLMDELVELEHFVRFDSTVTVVDAEQIEATLAESHIAEDQIKAADILLLNKQDLVDRARLQEVRNRLQMINPHAPVVLTTNGDIHRAMIFDVEIGGSAPRRGINSNFPGVDHGRRSHAHEGLWCRTISFRTPVNRADFLAAVDSLPTSVFRMKGLLDLSDPPQTVLFQYVAGRYDLSIFQNPVVKERFLTVIGKGDDAKALLMIETLLSKYL